MMFRRALPSLAALALGACQTTTATFEISPAEQAASEQSRLAHAGFEPVDALAARGLEVQRVDFLFDIICCQPSVQLTRDAAGKVTATLHHEGHRETAVVDRRLWDALRTRVAAGALVHPDQREARRRDRRAGVCHTWHTIEARFGGQRHALVATRCLGDLQARALDYAMALARAAVDTLPRCAPWRGEPLADRALYECAQSFGGPTEAFREMHNATSGN